MDHLSKIRKIANDFRAKLGALNLENLPEISDDDPMEKLDIVGALLPDKCATEIKFSFDMAVGDLPLVPDAYMALEYLTDDLDELAACREELAELIRNILADEERPTDSDDQAFYDASEDYALHLCMFQISLVAAAIETEHPDNEEALHAVDLVFRRVNRWSERYHEMLDATLAQEQKAFMGTWVESAAELAGRITDDEKKFFFPDYESDSDCQLLNPELAKVGFGLAELYAAYGVYVSKRFGLGYRCSLLKIDAVDYFRWLAANRLSNNQSSQVAFLWERQNQAESDGRLPV